MSMMSCEKISKTLVSYLDGRASERERASVEEHLKACAECRERAEEFRRLWNVMAEVPAAEPSFGFDARLRQRIASEPRRKLWAWMVPSPRLAASVALLIGLAVFVSVRPRHAQPVNTQASSEEQFQMIQDLGVLENYDVLSNFDALSDLPAAQSSEQPEEKPAGPGGGTGESWNGVAAGLRASEGL